MRTRLLGSAPIALAACLAAAPAASATSLLSTSVAAGSAIARTCHERLLSAGTAGSAQRALTMPAAGLVGAKLTAPGGDWDVAIFDRASGRVVSASEGFGSTEVAEGFLGGARGFTVQACRRSGSASSAQLSVFTQAVPAGTSAQKPSMIEVATPTLAAKDLLQTLDLDLTEHAEGGHADVVTYGASDLDKLRRAGLGYRVKVDDLVAQTRSDLAADRAFRARTSSSALPSGSTGYRHLWDYEAEMKALVAAAPELVKPITLAHPTLEGRAVHGIEITKDVSSADGSRSSCKSARITRASGRPASTRWSGRSSSCAATAATRG